MVQSNDTMPAARIVVHHHHALQLIVQHTIAAKGPRCSLNHLNVGRIEFFDALFKEVMGKIPLEILDFKVEVLTSGSIILNINELARDYFAFTWVFTRESAPVLVKVVSELGKKLLPESYKTEV